MHRGRERRLEHVREHGRERAYIKGVEEIADRDDILFIDPDKLDAEDPEELLKQFIKQAEGQLPEEITSEEGLEVKDILLDGEAAEGFTIFAHHVKDKGPAALTEAGIVITPSSDYETKEAYLRTAFKGIYEDDDPIVNKIIENMPGNDKDWNRFVGNHEGTHLAEDNDYDIVACFKNRTCYNFA